MSREPARVRVWHQGLNATNRVAGLRAKMESMARETAPELEVDFFGLGAGRGDADRLAGQAVRYLPAHRLQVDQIIRNAQQAESERYEAFIIGVLQDSGLREVRSLVDIPVVSYGEAAIHFGSMLAPRGAILAFNPDIFPLIEENLRRYDLHERFSLVDVGVTYEEIGEALEDSRSFIEKFEAAARKALTDGAGVLIPGQALICEAVYFSGLQRVDEVPVLNVRALCYELVKVMTNLRRSTGLDIARRGYFSQRVPADLLAIARDLYGGEGEDPRARSRGATASRAKR